MVPGAFYAEAGLAIGRQMTGWGFGCGSVAVAVDFEQALSVAKDSFVELDAHLTEATSSRASYKVVKDNRCVCLQASSFHGRDKDTCNMARARAHSQPRHEHSVLSRASVF